jgi:peptidoglycan/xylan/chitin deacetylase (PgdA/CDA1 family)
MTETSPRPASKTPQLSVCLTFDFDAVSLWTATFRSESPSEVSRGEFGPNVGVPRILELLKRQRVTATFFVPAVTARQFPDSVATIAADGHEIASHGDRHEWLVRREREVEAEIHQRALETLTNIAGTRPVGFRAPGWDLSPHTIGLLEELEFIYDSSQFGTDFHPYRARKGDVVGRYTWEPGETSALWEMPVSWELDDFPSFFIRPPDFVPGGSVDDVRSAWLAEFDYARRKALGGLFTLTLHPQIIGRGPRIEMLESLVTTMREYENVHFTTLAAVASRLSREPADAGSGGDI